MLIPLVWSLFSARIRNIDSSAGFTATIRAKVLHKSTNSSALALSGESDLRQKFKFDQDSNIILTSDKQSKFLYNLTKNTEALSTSSIESRLQFKASTVTESVGTFSNVLDYKFYSSINSESLHTSKINENQQRQQQFLPGGRVSYQRTQAKTKTKISSKSSIGFGNSLTCSLLFISKVRNETASQETRTIASIEDPDLLDIQNTLTLLVDDL